MRNKIDLYYFLRLNILSLMLGGKMFESKIHILMNELNTSNDDIDKGILIKEYKKVLRNFATKILRLNKEEYTISECKGGWASEGEVILHTENIYISVCPRKGMSQEDHQVLFRKCSGKKDYTGGMNYFTSAEKAFSENYINNFVSKLERLGEKK